MNFAGCNLPSDAECLVAIDNRGLWPNLTLLPDGTIAAVVYNHPSHGYGPDSGIELWVSADAGRSFAYRALVSDVSDCPGGIRMNHAVGVNLRGELVVIVSGYHPGQRPPLLPLQCCRSADGGQTWNRHALDLPGVPFGDILIVDGRLLCAFYTCAFAGERKDARTFRAYLAASDDQGASWTHFADIAGGVTETHLMRHSGGALFASCRTRCVDGMDGSLPHGAGEKLFRSTDGGNTWDTGRLMSPQGQENAHLLELRDGRLLYCLTSRIPGLFGVVYRLSSDAGQTWSVARPLVTIPAVDWRLTDCGYPSSVQTPDGTVVTAYYFGPKQPEYVAATTPWHTRYHMGVVRWKPG